MNIAGLHHVTAIAGNPQRNLDFYIGVLGLRLVKRTVNFDDPGSYHFYFGDAVGTPGTILTFFPWQNARSGSRGTGEVSATAYTIPAGSTAYWLKRLREKNVTLEHVASRFGEEVLRFPDPDGMTIELIGSKNAVDLPHWGASSVPAEHSLRGFHGVSAALDNPDATARLLTETFGYRFLGQEGDRQRYAAAEGGNVGQFIDLVLVPDGQRGHFGAGSVHHIALRASDEAQQLVWREKLTRLGHGVSPVMDRTYFHSIYFREPGGVLFEIATDGPGFQTDESLAELGRQLRLPAWMEASRARIEEILPKITLSMESEVGTAGT